MSDKNLNYRLTIDTSSFKKSIMTVSKSLKENLSVEALEKSFQSVGKSVQETEKKVKATGKAVKDANQDIKNTDASVKNTSKSVKDVDSSVKSANKSVKDTTASVKDTNNSVKSTSTSAKEAGKAFKETDSSVKSTTKSVKDTDKAVKDTTKSVKDTNKTTKDTGKTVKESFNPSPVKKFKDEVEKSKSAFSGMGGALQKLGGVMLTVFAVDKVKDFVVGAVESAASVKAVQAQFDQVFGDSSGIVQDKLNDMGKSMGILPERLKPGMSQMASMFKGLGINSTDATNMAAQGMTMSADAAAFYDKSLEEAQSNLSSFIKGNYEGGESIGLFGSAATMSAYASEKLGVNFDKLTEAEKQNVRLQFAQEMQRTSGAMGQAARESDGLENQLGNLKEAWKQFTAKIGNPILEKVVIPAITKIVTVLTTLGEGLGGLDSGGFSTFATSMQETGTQIKESLTESFEALKPAIENLKPLVEPLLTCFASLASIVGNVFTTAIAMVTPYIAMIIEKFTVLAPTVFDLVEKIKPLIENFLIIASVVAEKLQPVFSFLLDALGVGFTIVIGLIGGFIDFLSALSTNIVNFKDNCSTCLDAIKAYWELIWTTIMAKVMYIWTNLKTAATMKFTEIKDAIVNKATEIRDGFVNKITELKTNVVNKFTEIKTNTVNKIAEMVSSCVSKAQGFVTSFTSAFTSLPGKMLTIGSNVITGMLNGLKSAWSSVTGWVSEKATWVSDKFKSVLKIHSPSRVFVEIGQNIDRGLVKGLEGEEDDINNKVIGIASSIPKAFSKLSNMDVNANLKAVNKSASQTIIRSQVVPIVQLNIQGDIGAVVNKVSRKILFDTNSLIGGRV